jgi:hypothetical protein
MFPRALTIVSFVIAGILTVLGWQQFLTYKAPPVEKVALWFPLLVLIPLPDELLRILLSLVQFPLHDSFRYRHPPLAPALVLIVVLLTYAWCALAALAMVKSR